MKLNRIKKIIPIVCILLMMAGCSSSNEDTIKTFKISGDVKEVVEISNLDEFTKVDVQIEDKNNSCVKINDILDKAQKDKSYDIYVSSYDDVGVLMRGDQLEDTYISYNNDDQFRIYSKTHSVNSNIKDIEEITIISSCLDYENSVSIIKENENLKLITPGNLSMEIGEVQAILDGASSKDVNGKEYESMPYRKRALYKIENLIDVPIEKEVLAISKDGEEKILSKDSYLEIRENMIDCVDMENRVVLPNIKGIIIDPPKNSLKKLYDDISESLQGNKKVMVAYIDGLSDEAYEEYKEDLFINKGDKEVVTTSYKPVTNVGYAAMISGESPNVNGIHSRKERDLNCDSIFKIANELNKKTIIVEGVASILNTEIEATLNGDRNNNGYTDDEVYECASKNIDNMDFTFIHFHGLDEVGHECSLKNEKAKTKLKEIDKYISELAENFQGDIYIVSDHGMHKSGNEGNHGELRYEDMFIPYIIIKGV